MVKKKRMVDTTVPEEDEERAPPRSRIRAARRERQVRLEALAARLADLSDRALASLALGEELDEEVRRIGTMGHRRATARQRMRVAGLLDGAGDLDVLERRAEEARGATAQSAASTVGLRRLRNELLEGGDEALGRLFQANPDVDRPRLRQAVRAARREVAAGTPGPRVKELFQVLKDLGLGG